MKNIEDILKDLNRFTDMNVLEEHEEGEDMLKILFMKLFLLMYNFCPK